MGMLLSDEINWPRFNMWIKMFLEQKFHCVEEVRPVILRGEKKIRLLVAYHPRGRKHGIREKTLMITRATLLSGGVLLPESVAA